MEHATMIGVFLNELDQDGAKGSDISKYLKFISHYGFRKNFKIGKELSNLATRLKM